MDLLIIMSFGLAIGTTLGYWVGSKNEVDAVSGVKKYLEADYKEPWEAYKKGVKEGYERGLRDGESAHESA